ncbi:hypothetical protein BK816_07885 [Boudabousia tangfeifanii]|uniref:Uncharacterized protein n=1 Tax=Boudabousia tangfeifanii TaxID=1912795 RepID=A0A1D9MM04_9ACTO|nr:hypothetical protein [Boudabousia tangfeifanii]AOZ73219.1 hypothetical protein BK816_07885 [Boudabousia tangfeifanii]
MSGLMRSNFNEEIMTEISWLKQAVTAINDHLGMNSYVACLLRNFVEPEESQAIEQAIFHNARQIASMSFEESRAEINRAYKKIVGRDIGLRDEVIKELLALKLQELGLTSDLEIDS